MLHREPVMLKRSPIRCRHAPSTTPVAIGQPEASATWPGWNASGRHSAQRDPEAFDKLVTGAEDVLTTELTGWVQQMNDAMAELKNRQDSAAKKAASAPDGGHASSTEPRDDKHCGD
jgi:hypothetical protein